MADDFLRKQAWDYFQLHANQRLAVFNFYIVISGVASTAYFASFNADSSLRIARPALASLLCLIAFVFWKLDQRTKTLVKNAERALICYESKEEIECSCKVFTQEALDNKTKQKSLWRFLPWKWRLSYSDCFNFVFVVFFMLGIGGIALSLAGRPWAPPRHAQCICPAGLMQPCHDYQQTETSTLKK